MDIKVIAEASTELERQTVGWGLSFLVGDDLLFDTFSNGEVLKRNLPISNIRSLKYIVISHEHWDHTGGLWYILTENPRVKLFICKDFSPEFKSRVRDLNVELVEIDEPIEIKKDIFTSGEIMGKYNGNPLPEQALVIKNKELTVITGCAHPGIVKILRRIEEIFLLPIDLVIGGFHLYNKEKPEILGIIEEFKKIGVKRVAPCHCTGEMAVKLFEEEYKDRFIKVSTGESITI